jgi:hypothetical protein
LFNKTVKLLLSIWFGTPVWSGFVKGGRTCENCSIISKFIFLGYIYANLFVKSLLYYMEYLTVSIYIESFIVTCLKKKLPPLTLCWCIYLNEEMIGGLCWQTKCYFYNIDIVWYMYMFIEFIISVWKKIKSQNTNKNKIMFKIYIQ